MKKLIVVVALLFVPLLASAQERNALLTPDGTLYTVAVRARRAITRTS